MRIFFILSIVCLVIFGCDSQSSNETDSTTEQKVEAKPIPTLDKAPSDFAPKNGTFITHNLQHNEADDYPMTKKKNCFTILKQGCERNKAFESFLEKYKPEISHTVHGYMIWFKGETKIKDFTNYVDQHFKDYVVYPCYEQSMMNFAQYVDNDIVRRVGEYFFVSGRVRLKMNMPVLETPRELQREMAMLCQTLAQPVLEDGYSILLFPVEQHRLFEIANEFSEKFKEHLTAEVDLMLKYE